MVADPTRLTRAYIDAQVQRNLRTIDRINNRKPITAGRVVPESEDLSIHGGRRLSATVMFLDICKFSGRPSSTQEEQENLLQILALFFTEMIRIIEDYGGYLEKNTGDGLMAYFVRESEDTVAPQQKATAAALTMFDAARRLINPLIIRSRMQPVDFRITLDHGPITVAKVGAARGFNGIVAIGATANIASKMLAFAEPNTILMGEMVLDGLPEAWQTHVKLKNEDTGWFFTATRAPYRFFHFDAHWTEPSQ